MTVRLTLARGALRAVWVAVSIALVPLPAMATDADDAPATRNLRASMAKIVSRDLASVKPNHAVARRADQGTVAGAESASFFKTRTGILIAAVMIAGTGYALYSAQHDRLHSPGKK